MILGTSSTVQQIQQILVSEMAYLVDPSRILVYNQEYKFPPQKKPWIVVKLSGSRPYGNQNLTFIDNSGNFNEEQDLYTQDIITVTIMSKSIQALQYWPGIPMALRSIFSQQQQELNAFKIAQTMPVQDLSELEGGSMQYRFDVTVNVLACYQLVKTQTYFSNFETQVNVNDPGTGLITEEFNPAVLPTN